MDFWIHWEYIIRFPPQYQTMKSEGEDIDGKRDSSSSQRKPTVYHMGPDLPLTKHYYYLQSSDRSLSLPYAIWNLCMTEARRPSRCLIICKSESQINQIMRTYRLSRKYHILLENSHQKLSSILEEDKAQILITTDKKISALCALDEPLPAFNAIMNLAFHKSPEHYSKIHEFMVKTGGTTISFTKDPKDLHKIESSTGLNFKPIQALTTPEDQRKQLISTIQLMPAPKPETLAIIKMLPFSAQDSFARIFELLQSQFSIKKSKHLSLPGYISYQLKTSVEFNSLKYIWNYLSQLPEEITASIKGMVKLSNNMGVVFDVPDEYRPQMDDFMARENRHGRKNKDRKYWLDLVEVMPEIEDVESEGYKKREQQMEYALRHKEELEIFVGGLPSKMDEKEIREFFQSNQVSILTARILRDKTGQSKGVCFILCEDEANAKKALELNQATIGDKKIRVHTAEKKEQRDRSRSREKKSKQRHWDRSRSREHSHHHGRDKKRNH